MPKIQVQVNRAYLIGPRVAQVTGKDLTLVREQQIKRRQFGKVHSQENKQNFTLQKTRKTIGKFDQKLMIGEMTEIIDLEVHHRIQMRTV